MKRPALWIALCGLAMWSVACDSTQQPENCVADTESVDRPAAVELRAGTDPGAEVVGRLSFTQELIRYSGSNCSRQTESIVSVFASNSGLWQSASYAFTGTFTHPGGSWTFQGQVSNLLPRKFDRIGVVSLDPTRIDGGTFTASLASGPTFSEPPKPTLVLTSGGCGHLVFREKAGADLAEARAVVQARERAAHPTWTIAFEPYPVTVATRAGMTPPGTFSGVALRDPATGSLWHGVYEVVSSDGDIYEVAWCDD